MKKFFLALAFIAAAASVFAADKSSMTIKPKSKQVILVTKIVVESDIDRDFLFATRGVHESLKNSEDNYMLPLTGAPEQKNLFENGTFASVVYDIPRNSRIVGLTSIEYYFWSSRSAYLILPFMLGAKVPEGEQAIYIGSFYIKLKGDNFEVASVKRIDEFDAAKDYLKRTYNGEYNLMRIEELTDLSKVKADIDAK